MGELVLAAKITHVPSIYLSEQPGPAEGTRQNAIDGLKELGRRAADRGCDSFVVLDVHWAVTIGFHVNANERHAGEYTSHELPHFINGLTYEYRGDPELAKAIGEQGEAEGLQMRVHQFPGLSLEYGTLIPMRHMNPEGKMRVLPVACNENASMEEQAAFGKAIRAAIEASDRKAAVLASGSMSHEFAPNRLADQKRNEITDEFNRQVDLRVIELWQQGRFEEFLAMFPSYAERCHGEQRMADSAMLFGVLGWDAYRGKANVVTEYFPSTGTGQINVEFPVG
jgi:3,4-dihydroxyphenylacetate 2,3-dioxygenase